MYERLLIALGLFLLTIAGAAAIASVIVLGVLTISDLSSGSGAGGAASRLPDLLLMSWVTSMPFVAIGLVLIGLPVDWLLHKLEFRSVFAYAGFGAAGGLLFAELSFPGWWNVALVFLTYGAVAASLYWFVFPRRRPRHEEV